MGEKVFISYSHDSEEHRERVLALADRLRNDGIDCAIDRYEQAPPEGWLRWMRRQINEAGFVLVVCTETYVRRFNGEEQPGIGHGAGFESALILQALYNSGMLNERFIPIRFDRHAPIPEPLQPYPVYQQAEDYDGLYRRLTGQPEVTKPPIGPLRPMPSRPVTTWISAAVRRRFRWLATLPVLLISLGLIWFARLPPKLDGSAMQHYQKGLSALQELSLYQAEDSFRKALESGDFPLVRSAHAEVLLRLGRMGDAARESKKALERASHLPEGQSLLIKARDEWISGDCEEAIGWYDKLLALQPRDVDSVIGKAEAQIGDKQYTNALITLATIEDSKDPRLALTKSRVAESMSDYSLQREAASEAFAQASALGRKPIQVQALLLRAKALGGLGEVEPMLADLDEAGRLSRSHDYLSAQVLEAKGEFHLRMGDLKTSRRWLLEAEQLFRRLGDRQKVASIQVNLASVAAQQGDFGEARRSHQEAIKQYAALENLGESVRAKANLGMTWLYLGEPAEAIPLFNGARIYYQGKDRAEEALQQCNLGAAHLANLELVTAGENFAGCCAIACDLSNEQIVAIALQGQGDLLFKQGSFAEARKKFQRSIEIFERTGGFLGAAQGRLLLAAIEMDSGQPEAAIPLAEQAKEQFHQAGALEEVLASLVLVRAYPPSDPGAAQRELQQVKERAEKSEVLELSVRYDLASAVLLAAGGRSEAAFKRLEGAHSRTREKHPELEMETRLALAKLELERDRGRGLRSLRDLKSDAEDRGFWRIEAAAATHLGEASSRPSAAGLAALRTAPPPVAPSSCPCEQ